MVGSVANPRAVSEPQNSLGRRLQPIVSLLVIVRQCSACRQMTQRRHLRHRNAFAAAAATAAAAACALQASYQSAVTRTRPAVLLHPSKCEEAGRDVVDT